MSCREIALVALGMLFADHVPAWSLRIPVACLASSAGFQRPPRLPKGLVHGAMRSAGEAAGDFTRQISPGRGPARLCGQPSHSRRCTNPSPRWQDRPAYAPLDEAKPATPHGTTSSTDAYLHLEANLSTKRSRLPSASTMRWKIQRVEQSSASTPSPYRAMIRRAQSAVEEGRRSGGCASRAMSGSQRENQPRSARASRSCHTEAALGTRSER